MNRAAYLLVATLALLVPGSAYSRAQSGPTTIVSANGQIVAFAQDRGQIAWATSVTSAHGCPWQVRIRLLSGHRQKVIDPAGGPTCHSDTGFNPGAPTYLALAGKRALWTTRESGNEFYQQIYGGSYTSAHDVKLQELIYSNSYGDGDHLGGVAGDGSTLVYGDATVAISGPPDCDADGTCTTTISGGTIKLVVGGGTVDVPGAPAPAMLAAADTKIAVVVAEAEDPSSLTLKPGSPAHVQVLDTTGASVGAFSPAGTPLDLAFSPAAVAVLTSSAGGKTIEFFTPGGSPIRVVPVPGGAQDLSLSGALAVFRVGRSIKAVRVSSGAVHTLATATTAPVGLSIEGNRVAWAENLRLRGVMHGRIRAMTVH